MGTLCAANCLTGTLFEGILKETIKETIVVAITGAAMWGDETVSLILELKPEVETSIRSYAEAQGMSVEE